MTDDGKIISLRMGNDEIQNMDQYIDEHPEIGGRSILIRTAVNQYVAGDARVSVRAAESQKGICIEVKLAPADREVLAGLTESGMYLDLSDAVKTVVHEWIQQKIDQKEVEELIQSIYNAAISPNSLR